MNNEEYERMYRLEDSYWWFVGRHNLIETFLEKEYPGKNDLTILDIGCGTGAMSQKLNTKGLVVSADFSPLALTFSKKRGLNRLCNADAMNLPFKSESFDVIISLDILEHLPNDCAALREYLRVLKPGGKLFATVPAYASLWSGHDVALMHHRRYHTGELQRKVREAGFTLHKVSYAMTILCPVVWAYRKISRFFGNKPAASLVPVPSVINRSLTSLLNLENAWIKRKSFPFGVTLFCVANKQSSLPDK